MSLGERLKQRRLELGFDVRAVAKACGVSRSAVYQWEDGTTEPTCHNIVALADLLKSYEKYFTSGEEPKVREISAEALRPIESELIEGFRVLPEDVQESMKVTITTLAEERRKRGKRGGRG